MEYNEFTERMMTMVKDAVKDREAILTVTNSGGQSCSAKLYIVEANTVSYTDKLIFHPDYDNLVWEFFEYFERGVHLLRFSGGECVDRKHIRYFNPERLFGGIEYLVMYQEYGVEPVDERSKNYLAESLKAEKIKDTLVWACYIDDKELIKERLADPKLKPAQLNKKLELAGNPLILCAKHDDLESFRAIAEKGADVGKKISGEDTPLMTAFRYSYDIVKYILENYREQFDKEIKDFSVACLTSRSDERLYQLLKDAGVDMACEEGRPRPLLHIYARINNLTGIKFLLDNGVDTGLLNKEKQTALEVAEKNGSREAAELLRNQRGCN